MIRRPPRSTRTDTLFPYTTLFRSLVLGAVNLQVLQKQRVLDDGRTVLLALRPVDPRSLIQGDYMVLRYAEALVPQVDAAPAVDGRIVIALDDDGVATFRRFEDDRGLAPDEQFLRYRHRAPFGLDEGAAEVAIGAASFLFQDGHADTSAA